MDAINPDYYKSGGLEAIEVIEAFFPDNPHLAMAFKYLARMGKKPGNTLVQDAEKAKWYIDRWVKINAPVDYVPVTVDCDRITSDKENTEW